MPARRSALERLGMSPQETATRWRAPRAIHDQGRAALAAKSFTASSRARSAANSLHKIHFRRVRRDVEALVAGLAEDVPADTDARFVVETMGAAIRALPGVECDHNAHTVRVILRNIFDHSRNNAQIAKPQVATNQTSENQKSLSSRVIVRFCPVTLV